MSTDIELSKNFYLHEFTNIDHYKITIPQWDMLFNLTNNILEPIRKLLGDYPIYITNGVRTYQDYQNLLCNGYNPSITSDHFFGNVIKIPESFNYKITKYGKYYFYSVGACDFYHKKLSCKEVFDKLLKYANKKEKSLSFPEDVSKKKIKIGQLILEQNKKSKWLHISNPGTLIFSNKINKDYLNRKPFLTSYDNGKTYQEVI